MLLLLCCYRLSSRSEKTFTVQTSFFSWTQELWPSRETLQAWRNSLTVQGGAFTSSCWSGPGTLWGRTTATHCSPSLLPRFPGCGRWSKVNVPSFVNLVVAINTDILEGTVRGCANSATRDRVHYIPVGGCVFMCYGRLEDGQTSLYFDGSVQRGQVFSSSRTSQVVPQHQLVRNDLMH